MQNKNYYKLFTLNKNKKKMMNHFGIIIIKN